MIDPEEEEGGEEQRRIQRITPPAAGTTGVVDALVIIPDPGLPLVQDIDIDPGLLLLLGDIGIILPDPPPLHPTLVILPRGPPPHSVDVIAPNHPLQPMTNHPPVPGSLPFLFSLPPPPAPEQDKEVTLF